ncbi:formyl transferase [Kalaharituber pfeilii]|nr:formyl transferase [Kalaharituber pfeilii]
MLQLPLLLLKRNASPPATLPFLFAERLCRNALAFCFSNRTSFAPNSARSSSTVSTRPPLRILFCGSDHFSATSLKALHQDYLQDRRSIASIDVVAIKSKYAGRGLKTLKDVPIKSVAKELMLRVHEISTFTGWEPPNPTPGQFFNLVIAVSFGLLIPRRILFGAEYGGINVHPSLLPSYRGPAPIYHVLLNGEPFTGVTIQTLHPTRFDHGKILLQSQEVPIPQGTQYNTLHDKLAILGAEMLLRTCRERLFVPPATFVNSPYPPSEAPKIQAEIDSRIRFNEQDAREIERRCGALTTLWCKLGEPELLDRRKRVIFTQLSVWSEAKQGPVRKEFTAEGEPETIKSRMRIKPGTWHFQQTKGKIGVMLVKCRRGWIQVGGLKIEGKNLTHAGEWARSMVANARGPWMFS